jgi:dTDP-4-dehydrorhamnose reductase
MTVVEAGMSARRILVFGAQGQVGYELSRSLTALGEVVALDPQTGSYAFDFSQPDSLDAVVQAIEPDLIVNAAAYTAVDKAETEPDLVMRINADAPGRLAVMARELGIPFVHYSTDYVFDGNQQAPYSEADVPRPLSVYGRTKLAGEQAVQAADGDYLIFRTSWVYGARGHNFLRTILRLAREREELRIVADQIGAPNWCRDLARATTDALGVLTRQRAAGRTDAFAAARGIYHLSASGETSWHGFAEAILHQAWPAGAPCRLTAIRTEDYPTPARRPANSRLDTSRFRSVFGIALPDWRTALLQCLSENRPV